MRIVFLSGILAMLFISTLGAYQVPGSDAPSGAEVYILTFSEPGVLEYDGGINGLDSTARVLRARQKNAGANEDVLAYRDHLDSVLDNYTSQISSALSRSVAPLLRYHVRNTGMAVELTAAEAQHVAGMPGVLEVRKDMMYELDTDAGPTWIGANTIWDGSAVPGGGPNFGAGVLVGVMDTGVNLDHPSFSDAPEDGHTYVNPLGAGNFIGDCDGVTFICNDKLIGAWDFADAFGGESDGPEDGNGHGSHTASTAAGNFISGPFIDSGTGNPFAAPSISGVARHATLITYDVCDASCPGGAIQGGIDQALLDGVDVVNFSISGGRNPWSDNDRGFLDLTGNGTLVNASAGNTSMAVPDPVANVNHRGPWVNTIAAQTHNRVNSNPVSAVGGPSDLQDMFGLLGVLDAFGGSDVTAPGIYAGDIDPTNFEGCSAWPIGNEFTGAIAVISRGACNFSVKINNAAAAGAVAALIFNHATGGILPIVMGGIETTTIPSLMIGHNDGLALVAWLQGNRGVNMVTMEGNSVYSIIDSTGSILAGFSLRGPVNDFDLTKPDIGGPGVSIFAAYADVIGPPPQYTFLQGTSMSSPHLAGSSALLKAVHPNWTPAQIKSALMLTAKESFDEAGLPAHHDHDGAGTANLAEAALSGLIMDETFDNFLAANPATGGDPATLNLPSMRANDCNGTCSWTRTVCNALDVGTSWTVNTPPPSGYNVNVNVTSFDLASHGVLFGGGFEDSGAISSCQTFTTTVTVNDMQLVTDGNLIFDEIIISEDGAQAPDARLTITFLPTGVLP